ncbi:MAG: SDR family oxidoreductase [Bacteroidota bacterium]
MISFKKKRIWITGASSGIGEALAYEFSKMNTQLILSGRNQKKLEEVKNSCLQNGSAILTVPFDLSDMNSINNSVEIVLEKFGSVDLLINNGGISQRALVQNTTLDVDQKIMDVNYFGNIALTKALLPSMLKQGHGYIAVTTSIVGKFGFPMRSAYSASKHALYGFYETLRTELADQKIKVTMICPGRIQTNISFHALNEKGEEHGELDDGQKNGMPSNKAAKKIVKALQKEKREVVVGGKELLMLPLKRFAPYLFYYIIHKIKPT